MLAAFGELVDDIVVRLGGAIGTAINVGSDTAVTIEHRRGGSAANVTECAARLTGSARFLGQVGDDALGEQLLGQLANTGVDVACVRRQGRTGSIVVLVDDRGERTMLTDPGSSRSLDRPDRAWLDGVDVLHVPFYSLATEPIATTAMSLIEWAHDRAIAVSVDVSSVAVLRDTGLARVRTLFDRVAPQVVFANADEATLLDIVAPVAGAVTFVKRGPEPATVYTPDGAIAVDAIALERNPDSTGAGDAFAAGVMTSGLWSHDPRGACEAGHRAAASLLQSR